MRNIFNRTKEYENDWEDDIRTDWDAEPEEYISGDVEDYDEDSEGYGADHGEYCEEAAEYMDEDGVYYEEAAEYMTGDVEDYRGENAEYTTGDVEDYRGENAEYMTGDDVYYEETEEYMSEDGEYYEEAEEYIADVGDAYYEESEEYYEEPEDYYGDIEYFEDEEYGDSEYAEPYDYEERRGVAAWFLNMSAMDRVMLGTGVCVLLMAVITGVVFLRSQAVAKQVSGFADVGAQLEDIEIIGDEGLLAVADAALARQEAAKLLEQEQEQNYHEADYNKNVTVALKMVSVQKDLKIKFVNKSSEKLISNVPFSVTVTTADKKTETWDDEDMDGIIYRKGITPGSYQVTVNALSGDKYAGYTLPAGAQRTEVKKDIAYQKIDVSDEVKTESEINVATEEQKKQEPEVESALTDTVEWVESTAVTSTYIEVGKGSITDPMTSVKSGSFLRMAKGVRLNITTAEMKVGGKNLTLKAEYSFDDVISEGWSSSDTSVAEVDADGVVTAVSAGTATISCVVMVAKETDEGIEELEYEASCEVTVKEESAGETQEPTGETQEPSDEVPEPEPGTISLNKSAVTVYTSSPVKIKAVLGEGFDADISAESSDKKIATVEVDDENIIITGLKEGTATVTVSATDDYGTVSATCAVTVKQHPADDDTTPLKDNSGNQLYVQQEDGTYREAVNADYYIEGMKFFKKGETKYTGWQTLDGKVYFFDKTGKKVTGEQVIQGAKYNFGSDGALITGSGVMGIDVSKHNGTIDWSAVKNSGVSYVIIRCGYRGYTQGSLIIDPKFEQNIKGATSAGLKVGVYFFSQAVDEVEAVEEASFVLDAVRDYKISYPIFLDVEYSGASGNRGRADGLDKATRTAVCKAFCATVRSGGYTAGVYANKTWLQTMIDPGQLSSHKIWLAQYAAAPTYTGRYDMWQYKSTGRVSGISGNVDMNLSYMGY